MEINFIDDDIRSYVRPTTKPLLVESKPSSPDSIMLEISSAARWRLLINMNETEASAIGHSILAACQKVSTVSKLREGSL